MTMRGFIQGCAVEDTFICGNSRVGCIVGTVDSTTVQNSVIKNSHIRGRYMIGGVVGKSKKSNIVKITVTNSKIDGKRSTSGILGSGDRKINIRDCKVQETQISSKDTIHCVGDIGLKGEIKNTFVSDCRFITKDKHTKIQLFSKKGSITNSFITDSMIYAQELTLSATNSTINHSYADIEIITKDSVDQDITTTSTFYTTVTVTKPKQPKTVTVSEKTDLENVNVADTIQLEQDIDLENTEFSNLLRFSGTLNGNGHTISNVKGPLFGYTEAEFKDVTIQNTNLSKFTHNGIITYSATDTTFDNITVIQDTDFNRLSSLSGISYEINKSKIQDCSVKIETELKECLFSGVVDLVRDSQIRNTNVELNISNTGKTSGISRILQNSKIVNCQTTGRMSIKDTESAGLILEINNDSAVYQSHSDLTINSQHFNETRHAQNIAGLISLNHGKVKNCEFTGKLHSTQSEEEYESGIKTTNTEQSYKEHIEYNSFGGIVGKNKGRVIKCINTGQLEIDGINVGGIVGQCSSKITQCTNNGSIQGKRNVGGLVGTKKPSSVTKSSNQNNVSGEENIGGLIGCIKGESPVEIENCYVTESTQGDLLIGNIEDPSLDHNISSLYWNSDLEGESIYGKEYSGSTRSINTILQV